MSPTATVRVWVPDMWDIIDLPVSAGSTVAEVKAGALQAATGRTPDPSGYLVKYRGAVLLDEAETLGELDVPDRAPMIVLPLRRRPVR